ncbi:hypothetical protein [Algoriphagus mannitolivorans]|uniref:hypothetical protein n=1 Tax=Algoriphagus mannitolivorans TaxID=226504 RepID=UPI000416AFB2|nr:hypothetical protein [Algoriphagus mannitolivorans]
MNAEKLKLTIIQRVMKIDSKSSLERIEELLIREEMQRRADESIAAIEKGEVFSLEEFAKSNQEWLKQRNIK